MSDNTSIIDVNKLYEQLRSQDRRALAKAITLVESERRSDRLLADQLLNNCAAHQNDTLIIGITGVPGVGKSTFVDRIGVQAIENGHRVAVLAIDPSSKRSKGSIMGDKTRMDELSRAENAFIRPSPTSGFLGGASRRTREVAVLCACAGFDRIFIETVGVGQNELVIDEISDITLLLLLAGAGDELQGIKRGIMEAADIIAINKADGENLAASKRAASHLKNAISLLPARENGLKPDVLTCSALENTGVSNILDKIERIAITLTDNGQLQTKRAQRNVQWMRQRVEDALLERLHSDKALTSLMNDVSEEVRNGERSPIEASISVLDFMEKDPETPS